MYLTKKLWKHLVTPGEARQNYGINNYTIFGSVFRGYVVLVLHISVKLL
jgi:predicted nucleotidyltransferase